MRFGSPPAFLAPHHPGARTAIKARDVGRPADLIRRLAVPLVAIALLLMSIDLAEAKRLGGGNSFGSKNSYSKSYDKPTAADKNMTARQATPNPQANAAPGGFMSRFGGVGGLLGGLLVGGMLGSLLFGGVGGGFGILEILLLGGAGFMLFRFLRSRKAGRMETEQASPTAGDRFAYATASAHTPAGNVGGWDSLRSMPGGGGSPAEAARPVMPADLDEKEFLTGAKALYMRLQASWDRRDLADIREFTSPEVFAEISRQAKEDPTPSTTDILMAEVRILEVNAQGAQTVISVLCDVLLRETPTDSRPAQAREVWHIRRDESDSKPQWILEGIQQLDR